MTQSLDEQLEEPDPEIKRKLTNIRKTKAYLKVVMIEDNEWVGENVLPRSLKDYTTPWLDGIVKLATITMI